MQQTLSEGCLTTSYWTSSFPAEGPFAASLSQADGSLAWCALGTVVQNQRLLGHKYHCSMTVDGISMTVNSWQTGGRFHQEVWSKTVWDLTILLRTIYNLKLNDFFTYGIFHSESHTMVDGPKITKILPVSPQIRAQLYQFYINVIVSEYCMVLRTTVISVTSRMILPLLFINAGSYLF